MCVCDFSAPELRINISCERAQVCVTTLPPDDKAVRASTGSHKITRDFSDIFFIVLWDCARERALRYKYFNIECTLGRSQKQQSSSIRSRQAAASTTENTHSHSHNFVALEKSFCTHLFFIMHTYSAYALVRVVPQRRRLHLQLILSAPLI